MAVQGAELGSDIFDVFGDSGLVPGGVKAEDRLVDLFLGEGLAAVQGQVFADGVLPPGELHRLLSPVNRLLPQVKIQAAPAEPVLGGTVLPAQVGRDPGPELPQAKGLGEVVIAAQAQSLDDVGLLGFGGEEENGTVCQGTDQLAGGKAVLPGHHHVQQNTVGPAAMGLGDGAAPVQGSSPKPFMDTLKGAGCLVMHKIPDSRFAHTAQEVGCDAVCIVGYEGGGHPGMAGVGSLVQWPLTTERCTLPVVGAGGVCDGRTLYAALAAGLDGVMVGTRFLMAQETDIGPRLRQTVIDARETDTVLTQTSIRNALRSLKTQGALDIIAFEQHHPTFDELYPLIRGTVTKAAYEQDEPQAAQIAIGQVLGRIHDVKPAAQIIREMVEELYDMHQRVSAML